MGERGAAQTICMIRLCDAAVKIGNYQNPYQRVLALFFPKLEPPKRTVLAGVTMQMTHGSALAVLGEAETLFRLVAGEVDCALGTADIHGHVARAARGGDALLPFLSGRGNALLSARLAGMQGRDAYSMVREAQSIFASTALPRPETEAAGDTEPVQAQAESADIRFKKPVSTYTPAERARLAISIALSLEPDTLLTDECLGELPPGELAAIIARIRARQAGGMCVLMHEPQEIAQMLCPRAIWIEHGVAQQIGAFTQVAMSRRAARCKRGILVSTFSRSAGRARRGREQATPPGDESVQQEQ